MEKKLMKNIRELILKPSFLAPFLYLAFLLLTAITFYLIGEVLMFILENIVFYLEERAYLESQLLVANLKKEFLDYELLRLKGENSELLRKLDEIKKKVAVVKEIKDSATKK